VAWSGDSPAVSGDQDVAGHVASSLNGLAPRPLAQPQFVRADTGDWFAAERLPRPGGRSSSAPRRRPVPPRDIAIRIPIVRVRKPLTTVERPSLRARPARTDSSGLPNVPCRPWSSYVPLAAERNGSALTVPTAVLERATSGVAKSSMTLSSSTRTAWPVSAQTLGALALCRPRTGSGSGRWICRPRPDAPLARLRVPLVALARGFATKFRQSWRREWTR
jgi:hypothetical protein